MAYMNWNKVGETIAKIRTKNNLSLSEMGELIGKKKSGGKKVSHVTIRNWESGSTIQKENWDALIAALSMLDPDETKKLLSETNGSAKNIIKENGAIYADKLSNIFALSSDSQKALIEEIQQMIEEGRLTDQVADAMRTILQSVQANKKQAGLFKR